MYRIFSKQLAILFALLLGLAQLPMAVAGNVACENAGDMHKMQAVHTSQHGLTSVQHDAAGDNACQHCDVEQNSTCQDCGTGHCGVCAVHGGSAMLPSVFDVLDASVSDLDMRMADGLLPAVQFSFLRPPILI